MATATEAVIPDLLLRHLHGLVLSPALPIAQPNVDFTGAASSYLEPRWFPNRHFNLALGATDQTEHRGLFQVNVVAPQGAGVIKAGEVAGQVVARFAKGTVLRQGVIAVRVTAKPWLMSPLVDDGKLTLPVTIPYQSFN